MAETPKKYDSTDDKRAAENNIVRHQYRALTDAEKQNISVIKDIGLAFIAQCDATGASRELSLAKTKMEEAVMWAVKHITK